MLQTPNEPPFDLCTRTVMFILASLVLQTFCALLCRQEEVFPVFLSAALGRASLLNHILNYLLVQLVSYPSTFLKWFLCSPSRPLSLSLSYSLPYAFQVKLTNMEGIVVDVPVYADDPVLHAKIPNVLEAKVFTEWLGKIEKDPLLFIKNVRFNDSSSKKIYVAAVPFLFFPFSLSFFFFHPFYLFLHILLLLLFFSRLDSVSDEHTIPPPFMHACLHVRMSLFTYCPHFTLHGGATFVIVCLRGCGWQVLVQSIDMFGRRVGFIKFKAGTDADADTTLPPP